MRSQNIPLLLLLASTAVACGDADTTLSEVQCDEPSASDPEDATSLYLDAWNEADAVTRVCAIQRSLDEDAILIDGSGTPGGRLEVVHRLDTAIELLSEEGITRELDGPILYRHREALLAWSLVDASGTVIERGQDWLEFAGSGLLARIHILAGGGAEASATDELLAWERAWNTPDQAALLEELRIATTEDVRFTDLLTDVQGREPLAAEIRRQQTAFDSALFLGESLRVFATQGERSLLIRQSAQVIFSDGGTLDVVNYVRFRDGRIERLSGFPASSL
ncbi:MAG: nuclear transport factor 2 family protein [Myxococcales bacterium]|nr:nuclear transport factor 2 family protein [Myxococcales bacterium]MDH3842310.1 nuclear transport factor 2 family protein [Myxococcales bacterium]